MATKKGAAKKDAKKGAGGKAKAMTEGTENQHTRAYTADMSSLKGLELTCEADEANLLAKITSLELGQDDGVDVTVGDYEDDDTTILGELTFEQYKTDVDKQSLKAIHKTKGDTFLFEGEAFIKNAAIKLLVFRDKQ
jgi:hypothetical protein